MSLQSKHVIRTSLHIRNANHNLFLNKFGLLSGFIVELIKCVHKIDLYIKNR